MVAIPQATVGRQLSFNDPRLNQEIDRLYIALQQRYQKISPRTQLDLKELRILLPGLLQDEKLTFERKVDLQKGVRFLDQYGEGILVIGDKPTTTLHGIIYATATMTATGTVADGVAVTKTFTVPGVSDQDVASISGSQASWMFYASPLDNQIRVTAVQHSGGAISLDSTVRIASIRLSDG